MARCGCARVAQADHKGARVADSLSAGAELEKQSRDCHAIERVATGVTAFIGRTLRGPVDQPLTVSSFGEFQQQFGGLWQPSTLSYALEQFFENGGREARIVRVVNGAGPPTVTPAGRPRCAAARGAQPGSREYLRASVDYDGITVAEHERFNLVVQRVRAAGLRAGGGPGDLSPRVDGARLRAVRRRRAAESRLVRV